MNDDHFVLAFDPFQGDFGDQGDAVFVDKMATARKVGPCSHCKTDIQKGERIRRQSGKFDGEMMSYRWCSLCCDAMALCMSSDDDGGEAFEARGVRS